MRGDLASTFPFRHRQRMQCRRQRTGMPTIRPASKIEEWVEPVDSLTEVLTGHALHRGADHAGQLEPRDGETALSSAAQSEAGTTPSVRECKGTGEGNMP